MLHKFAKFCRHLNGREHKLAFEHQINNCKIWPLYSAIISSLVFNKHVEGFSFTLDQLSELWPYSMHPFDLSNFTFNIHEEKFIVLHRCIGVLLQLKKKNAKNAPKQDMYAG